MAPHPGHTDQTSRPDHHLDRQHPRARLTDSIYSQKVQGEPDAANRPYFVIHLGWDRLLRSSVEFVFEGRLTGHRKLKVTVVDVDSPPNTGAEAVKPKQTSRKAAFIPLRTCTHRTQIGMELRSVAEGALEALTESAGASCRALHPGPLSKGGRCRTCWHGRTRARPPSRTRCLGGSQRSPVALRSAYVRLSRHESL